MLQREVAAGIHRIEDGPVNWYLVEDDDGVIAVDAGLPASWSSLHDALSTIGRRRDELRAIVLTHGHFDHVGFARRARQELGVPVHCHPDDFGVAHHPLRYDTERSPALYAWRPKTMRLMGRMVAAGALWAKGIEELEALAPGDALDLPGRPRVLATPGHTHGHVALHLPDRDALIAGDALVTLDPYTGFRGPRLVARAATADSARALASLEALAATRAKVVLPGHGEPFLGGAQLAAEQAASAGAA